MTRWLKPAPEHLWHIIHSANGYQESSGNWWVEFENIHYKPRDLERNGQSLCRDCLTKAWDWQTTEIWTLKRLKHLCHCNFVTYRTITEKRQYGLWRQDHISHVQWLSLSNDAWVCRDAQRSVNDWLHQTTMVFRELSSCLMQLSVRLSNALCWMCSHLQIVSECRLTWGAMINSLDQT